MNRDFLPSSLFFRNLFSRHFKQKLSFVFEKKTFLPPEKQWEEIRRHAVDIVSKEELLKKLEKSFREKKALTIKAGFDPSRPDLHFGHLILLNKLKVFQNLGHEVVFLVGDFTARIGDPSGTDTTRPLLSFAEVKKNAQTYCQQAFKILDSQKTKVCFNSSWMSKMKAIDLVRLAGKVTVARMLERDDFSHRFKSHQPLGIHEFLYPLIQGWDSVVLKADVELGGTDQLFNLLTGRELQKREGHEPQCVLTLPILEGLDGVKKMSKTYDNYIAVEDSPKEMFGKTLKLNDELMLKYYELLTGKTETEIKQLKEDLQSGKLHPMEAKKNLACFFVQKFYSSSIAQKEKENFENVFSKGGRPSDMPERIVSPAKEVWICHLLREVGLAPSSSEATRLIKGGAVEWNEEKIKDSNLKLNLKEGESYVLKAGKRRFIKIKVQA